MNTVALGFVGTPRASGQRDSYFTGSSNNPSKKGSMIAVARPVPQQRRVDPTVPNKYSRSPKEVAPPPAPSPIARAENTSSKLAAPPHANNLTMLERRCDYLDLQTKRQTTMIADQSLYIKNLEDKLVEPSNLFSGWLHGRVLNGTTEYTMTDIGKDPDCARDGVAVHEGTVVNVCYPMKRLHSEGSTRIVMCRRRVEPTTGQILTSWIVVYTGGGQQ